MAALATSYSPTSATWHEADRQVAAWNDCPSVAAKLQNSSRPRPMPLRKGIPISILRNNNQHGNGANGKTATQARRVHAAGLHPHRRLALSRGLAGCQFQFPA